ncbi:MAG TPA: hypothetical protein VJL29_02105, partial [Thermoguttaceae bacterium]|nr:hypothetical protein [Thermoguttaceae bacterium]
NRLGPTDDKIAKLIALVEMPMTDSPLETLKTFAGVQEGLDEDGAAAIVALPADEPGDKPLPLVLVPVKDYQAVVAGMNPEKVTDAISRVKVNDAPSLVAEKDGYAVFVQADDQKLLESVLVGKTKSVAEKMVPWKTWIEESDAVVVLGREALSLFVNKATGEIDKAMPMFDAMGEQGVQARAGMEMYRSMLVTAGDELTAVGVGALIEEDGAVRLSSRGRFTPDGKLAGWFKNVKPLPAHPWAGVPNEPFVVAAGGVLPEGLIEKLTQFSMGMAKNMPNVYGMNEEQMKKITEMSVKAMKGVHGMTMAVGVVPAGQPIYQGVTATFWVDDSEAFLNDYAALVKSMAELSADAEKSPLKSMTATPTEIAGRKGLEVSMDMSAMYDNPQFARMESLFKAMYGPDSKLDVYMAAADKTTVVAAYIDKARAVKAVETFGQTGENLSSNETVGEVLKRLPADSQWVGLWSPRGTIAFAQQVMESLAPEGQGMSLPEFPETPPVGFAAKVSPTDAQKELLIPADVIKQIAAYVKQVASMSMASL